MFTRAPTNFASDRRRPLTIILAVVGGLYLLLTAAGSFWTDFLWFESIGFRNVWLRNWSLSILLGVIGISLVFLVLWLSLKLVDRLSPRWAPFELTEEEELIERFRGVDRAESQSGSIYRHWWPKRDSWSHRCDLAR